VILHSIYTLFYVRLARRLAEAPKFIKAILGRMQSCHMCMSVGSCCPDPIHEEAFTGSSVGGDSIRGVFQPHDDVSVL
jgi:hypothetical protein